MRYPRNTASNKTTIVFHVKEMIEPMYALIYFINYVDVFRNCNNAAN